VPRISVVVPIFNVERYLPACLGSLAAQTVEDLEVVMVDDGSTDDGPEIARRFAARDPRFRLIEQANAGLGSARNTGTAAAGGELLAFVDSDDVVPHDAYERLVAALDATGSDFAAGNVQRLHGARVTQAAFLAKTFARTRLSTHVTRFRPLLADRIACNKLWRRTFWEANDLRFPEGVLHEDIPVTLPAHLMAGSVDVLADTVYRYRIRADGERSITQRRLELRVLTDRLAAVEHVRAHLAANAPRRVRRWYDERLVADDLRLHLDLMADADDAYRACFMTRVNALLDDAGPLPTRGLPAIDRLKWHLVRRGLVDELVEVLRFQREQRASTPPQRRWRFGRWYGAYPFRDDPALAIPRSTYRLGKRDAELSLRATVDGLRRAGDRLVVTGHAHIDGLPVAAPGDQSVRVLALRPGRWERLALHLPLGAVSVPARAVRRPELEPLGTADRTWSGFEAQLPLSALAGRGGRRSADRRQLYVFVRAGGVRRRLVRFALDDVTAVELPGARPGVSLRAAPQPAGRLEIQVRDRWATARAPRLVDGDVVELGGDLRLDADADVVLEARRSADGARVEVPVRRAGTALEAGFLARLPLSDLAAAETDRPAADDALWTLALREGRRRLPVGLEDAPQPLHWWASGRELALVRTPAGDAAVVARDVRPLVTGARWLDADGLRVDVRLPAGALPRELVLVDWHRGHERVFALHADDPVEGEPDAGAFHAIVSARDLLAVPAGISPRRGGWTLYGRPLAATQRTAMARVRLDRDLFAVLPLTATVDDRPLTLAPAADGGALLSVPQRSAAPAPARGGSGRAAPSADAAASAG
jgi:CDP-glycerol glycerophosphotransferase